MIYFISDTHFCCFRAFKYIEEINEELIKNWNYVANKDDIVYFLGDFCLGSKVLVRENHDRGRGAFYEKIGFKVLSHMPVDITKIPDGYTDIHGHIHNRKDI